jgi:hypothetical protein
MSTSKLKVQHVQPAQAGSSAQKPNDLAFSREKSGGMLRASKNGPRSVTERWGGNQILFSEGFLSVPTRFLRRYASLNPPLTTGEALFVLQLMTFKWERAAPFPSYGSIAKAMGVTDKMARRYAQRLQKKGYLIRQFQYRAPNKFDLTGLFEALAGTLATDQEK